MHAAELVVVDFVEELRLRRWARENYCYPEARMASWHPVIHDEMRRRDADSELVDQASVLVDKDESPSPTDSTILTDIPELDGISTSAHEAAIESMRPFGAIVPLVPDMPGLHGPHEITPPHTRTSAGVPPAELNTEMHYT